MDQPAHNMLLARTAVSSNTLISFRKPKAFLDQEHVHSLASYVDLIFWLGKRNRVLDKLEAELTKRHCLAGRITNCQSAECDLLEVGYQRGL